MWKWLFGDSYSISREEFLSYKAEQQATNIALWDQIKSLAKVNEIQVNAIEKLINRINGKL